MCFSMCQTSLEVCHWPTPFSVRTRHYLHLISLFLTGLLSHLPLPARVTVLHITKHRLHWLHRLIERKATLVLRTSVRSAKIGICGPVPHLIRQKSEVDHLPQRSITLWGDSIPATKQTDVVPLLWRPPGKSSSKMDGNLAEQLMHFSVCRDKIWGSETLVERENGAACTIPVLRICIRSHCMAYIWHVGAVICRHHNVN